MRNQNAKNTPLENAAGLLFETVWTDGALRLICRPAEILFDLGETLIAKIDRPFPGHVGTYHVADRGQFLNLNFPAMRPPSHACAGSPNNAGALGAPAFKEQAAA